MRPDLYIAAMGRSGSTMIENWLTCPREQILVCEPGFCDKILSEKTITQCEEFSIEFSKIANRVQDLQQWLSETFHIDQAVTRWGFKEVLGTLHRRCLDELDPEFILVTVRNIEDVYLSFIEKHRVQNNEQRFSENWSFDYCVREAELMVEFVGLLEDGGRPHLVVRYEDFIARQGCRSEIEQATGWRGGGVLDRHFELFGRGFEARQHGGEISAVPRKICQRSIDPIHIEKAKQLGQICSAYQARFGYVKNGV